MTSSKLRIVLGLTLLVVMVAAGLLAVRGSGYLDYRALRRHGVEADGVLRTKVHGGGFSTAADRGNHLPYTDFLMTFEYRDPDGRMHRFVHHASQLFYAAHDVGCHTDDWYLACEPFLHTILYLPQAPHVAAPAEDLHFHAALLAAAGALFVLVLVGVVLLISFVSDRRRWQAPSSA